MKYTPTTIATNDIGVVRKHSLGGEKKLWMTRVLAAKVGSIEVAGDGSGVYTADAVTTLPGSGADLVVKVDGEVRSLDGTNPVILTIVGTDQASALLSGTATFSPPGWVPNKTNDFTEGFALDITTNGVNKKWKTITAITIPNAKKGSNVSLFTMPDTTDWQYIDMVESVDPHVGISPGVSIPDGLDGTAEVVRGRSEENKIAINALYRSVADGIQRFGGADCCVRMDIFKAGKILAERHIFANAILSANSTFPDGSETAKQAGEGIFSDALLFVAP